jgi:serine/threonine-protein kinase
MTLDQDRWSRIQAVFHRIVDAMAGERDALLNEACGTDDGLKEAVSRLLEADASSNSVIDRDIARVAGDLLGSAAPASSRPFDFGPYRVIRPIGEGGMGIVFLAERSDLGQVTAIKVLREVWVSPLGRERFAREQQTLARLSHPSIARVYHADTLADGTPWFAMEYVAGTSLTDYCAQQVDDVRRRVRLFRDVCEAVRYAHEQLVVHRDLKPSNILVTPDGAVKLLDFGIAKPIDMVEQSSDRTRTVLRFMTPNYAAPEQLAGARTSISSDIYSLGVILYELLTGRRPFDLSDRTPQEAEEIVREQEPGRPSSAARGAAHVRGLSQATWDDLDVLCLTAMHKDPARRYRSVEALIRDLDHFHRGEPLEARPDRIGYRLSKFVKRNRRQVTAAAVVLAMLVGTVAFYTGRLREQRSLALMEAQKAGQVSEYVIDLFEASDPFAPASERLDLAAVLRHGVERADRLSAQPGVQAQMLTVLGRVHTRLSEPGSAEQLLKRALMLRRAANDPLAIAETLTALGKLYAMTIQRDRAEEHLREALAIRRQHLGERHPLVGSTLNELGSILTEKGRVEEAERLYLRALEIQRSAYREPREEIAQTLTNLGVNYFNRGLLEQAEPYYREALAVDRQIYGPEHPNVAVKMANLALVLEARRDVAAADAMLTEALGILQRTLGAEHYLTAYYQITLGSMMRRRGAYGRAEAVLREALAIHERRLGAEHPNTTVARNQLALTLVALERYAEAEPLLRHVVGAFREQFGDHYYSGSSLCQLANVLRLTGKPSEAEPLMREGLAILKRVLPAQHPDLALNRSRYGALLASQSRFAEAEPLLLDSYQVLHARYGIAHGRTREAASNLVMLYESWNRPQEAEPYR